MKMSNAMKIRGNGVFSTSSFYSPSIISNFFSFLLFALLHDTVNNTTNLAQEMAKVKNEKIAVEGRSVKDIIRMESTYKNG